MFDMKQTGKKITELRKKDNMTQMELADRLGISFQAVSNWERGNTMPDISKLPELADIFYISLDELLGFHSISSYPYALSLLSSVINIIVHTRRDFLTLNMLLSNPSFKKSPAYVSHRIQGILTL